MKPIARMAPFERRALTQGEVAVGRIVFADAIDWGRVRLVQGPSSAPFGAMVPAGRTILFGRWRAARDFAEAGLEEQGWLVHELTHVWQAGRGVVLAAAKLAALGRRAYRLPPLEGRAFASLNIEGQAEVARLLFHARLSAPTPRQPDRAVLERLWPISPSPA